VISLIYPIRRGAVAAALAMLVVVSLAGHTSAEVFYARDEALALAFPGNTSVEARTAFLTTEQVDVVARRTGTGLESQLFDYYVGRRDGAVTGYAVIETHVVRTLPETFLVVLTPEGVVERVTLLAFYEPREYMPSKRWTSQFEGRSAGDSGWRLGHDVHGISGATLTASAVPRALQKILLFYDLVMRQEG
jgi:hypothetical protein